MARKSEEMPNEHERTDIESGIQNTDQIEQLPFSPADQIVSDSVSSEGKCNCIWSISRINRFINLIKAVLVSLNFHNFLSFRIQCCWMDSYGVLWCFLTHPWRVRRCKLGDSMVLPRTLRIRISNDRPNGTKLPFHELQMVVNGESLG